MHSDIKQLDKKVSKLVRVTRDCKLPGAIQIRHVLP